MRVALHLGVSCAVMVACSSRAGSNNAPAPDAGGGTNPVAGDSAPSGPGHVVFLHPDQRWRRMPATPGADADDLTRVIDALSGGRGTDQALSLSADGAWLTGDSSQRIGCSGGADCVIWSTIDGARGGDVRPGGSAQAIPSGRPAIASGGGLIVYPRTTSPGHVDLVSVTRNGDGSWGAEVSLTAASPYPYAHDPSISPDGTKVAFDCGPSPYQDPATSICEASVDGSAFRVLVKYTDGPDGPDGGDAGDWECHHPGYAPDGSLVFEADWGRTGHDETIWRLPPGGKPTRVSPSDVHDDNSPCVLPDGRIASLWLDRTAADGTQKNLHELKVMDPDGTNGVMLVTDVDLVDVGLTCGE